MRHALSAFLLVAASSAAFAQGQPPAQTQTSGPILSLEEAVQIAVRSNPAHLQVTSSRSRQGAALRTAYGQLLPRVSSSFGASFRQGGQELVGGVRFGAGGDQLSSNYSIGVTANYSGATLLTPRVARANLDAADADVVRSIANTRALVVTQYLNVLQAQARAALQDTLLANAQAQLELNRARQAVGATTSLEVRRSEVQVGRMQVAVLTQRNAVEIETLRLFQQMGIDKIDGVRLTSSFPVVEPSVQLAELLTMARSTNPSLNAARARGSAAEVGVKSARSQWLPSLSLSTGFYGYTSQQTNIEPQIAGERIQGEASRRSCLTSDSIRTGAGLAALGDCDRFLFTDADAAAARSANNAFPFSFTRQPLQYSVGLSLPIFDGFRREQSIQEASLSRNDARYQLRAQELLMNTEVTSAYRTLVTSYQSVKLQEQNRVAAQQALDLAVERYRVGATTFTDVTQARAEFEQASTDLINAVYDFHKAYAELERAVGRPLR